MTSSTDPAAATWLRAGRVAAPHGLDGSFYVAEPRPQLLMLGTMLQLAGKTRQVVRRAGTDRRPLIRLEGISEREAVVALRGRELLAARGSAPALDADEWWVEDLEGCTVSDGPVLVGRVRRVLPLPSCEVLEVARDGAGDLLVPLVGDAVRSVDVGAQRIDIDLVFLGEA